MMRSKCLTSLRLAVRIDKRTFHPLSGLKLILTIDGVAHVLQVMQ